jgi:hypothetical protein
MNTPEDDRRRGPMSGCNAPEAQCEVGQPPALPHITKLPAQLCSGASVMVRKCMMLLKAG